MSKKKKTVLIVSAVILFILLLGSCGSDSSKSTDKKISNVQTTTKESIKESQASPSSKVMVAETVLLDQSGVKITATGMDDGLFGTNLKLLIENNSNVGLTFQARKTSVNGYMVDTTMSEDVAPGKKANTELTFMTSGLKDCGIDTIAYMEFSFHIFTTDGWDAYIDTDVIKLNTSAAGSIVQNYDDSGEILYNQNGIKIIGKGLSNDESIFGPGLIVYIENNTSQDITVQVRDTSINGFMVDTTMSEDVIAGKKAITAVTFMKSSLDENGITQITSVETSFHVFDMNSWDTIVDTAPIVINF